MSVQIHILHLIEILRDFLRKISLKKTHFRKEKKKKKKAISTSAAPLNFI